VLLRLFLQGGGEAGVGEEAGEGKEAWGGGEAPFETSNSWMDCGQQVNVLL